MQFESELLFKALEPDSFTFSIFRFFEIKFELVQLKLVFVLFAFYLLFLFFFMQLVQSIRDQLASILISKDQTFVLRRVPDTTSLQAGVSWSDFALLLKFSNWVGVWLDVFFSEFLLSQLVQSVMHLLHFAFVHQVYNLLRKVIKFRRCSHFSLLLEFLEILFFLGVLRFVFKVLFLILDELV